jgi:hypothetical protein
VKKKQQKNKQQRRKAKKRTTAKWAKPTTSHVNIPEKKSAETV